jgi:hypothetical protein
MQHGQWPVERCVSSHPHQLLTTATPRVGKLVAHCLMQGGLALVADGFRTSAQSVGSLQTAGGLASGPLQRASD